ncbi:MAG: peptidase M28, partial [Acidobacteria bacterium]|nr:peptidase M28 [Acidobacteriota bacterium]
MKSLAISLAALVLTLGLWNCSTAPETVAFPDIDGNAVLEHTKVLASDEFEGRAPGTRGEDLTVRYIEDQFRQAGLQPGNSDGTYVQA